MNKKNFILETTSLTNLLSGGKTTTLRVAGYLLFRFLDRRERACLNDIRTVSVKAIMNFHTIDLCQFVLYNHNNFFRIVNYEEEIDFFFRIFTDADLIDACEGLSKKCIWKKRTSINIHPRDFKKKFILFEMFGRKDDKLGLDFR